MSPIKSMADIPTPFKHKEIFKEYQEEITSIKMVDYAKILETSKQNISIKFKSDSNLLYKERDKLLKHLESKHFIDIPLYSKLSDNNLDTETLRSNIPIRYEVSASCGNGIDVYDEETQDNISLPHNFLQYFRADFKSSEIIFAEGDSMSPEINAGDMLLVDKSKTHIINDLIYIFNYDGQPMCKRLQKSGDKIKAISVNTNYEPFIIDRTLHFSIIGRVVGLFRQVI